MTATLDPLHRVLAALSAKGRKIRPQGDGSYKAQCSAHFPDDDPSLSIKEGHDGRVLLLCRAGCSTEAVVAGLDLRMADLFADEPRQRSSKPEITATYPYRRLDGSVAFEVVRLTPKSFRQRRPARPGENARDGWVWSTRDLPDEDRCLPYRLHDIAEAIREGGEPAVLVVEGERDAHTLAELGYLSTSNAGGAGKWTAQHARHLLVAGVREAVIIADRDEPGTAHAEQVVESLRAVGIDCDGYAVLSCPCNCKDPSDARLRHGDDVTAWPLSPVTILPEGEHAELDAAYEPPGAHARDGDATHATMATLDRLPSSEPQNAVAFDGDRNATPATAPVPELDSLGILGRFAKALAARFEVTAEFALATALGAVAIPCGLGLTVGIDADRREPALLHLLVVAAPGERKSPLLKATIGGLRAAERELREKRDAEIAQFEFEAVMLDEMIAATKRGGDPSQRAELIARRKAMVAPPRFRAMIRSGTGEALEKLAAEQGGKLAVVTDEGGALFGDLSRYANTPNIEVILAGYDGDPYSSGRITRDLVDVGQLRLPILAMAQPVVLAALRGDPTGNGRGLLPRFSVVVPGSLVGMRTCDTEPIDPGLVAEWERLTAELMHQAYGPEPLVAALTPAARGRLTAYAQCVEARMNSVLDAPVLREWGAKHEGRTARLAGILHAVLTGSLGGTIEPEHVELAVGIAEWLAWHAVAQLGGMGRGLSRDADKLLRWGEARESFTRREAIRSLHWRADRFDAAMRELVELGLAESDGRPAAVARWQVGGDE